ncbi:MAG: AAA family ATPase, partial [Clostridiales bacterium]|nr:AAA family ATPase [Clostridiales bacterium]
MGIYLNPGNNPFKSISNDKIYVDKTGLIDFVNDTIGTPRRMTCFSRPRRFGKSFAAMMLCAYYSKGFDSHELFEGLEISKCNSFETYMNKLNVIYIDVTRTISIMRDVKKVVSNIESEVVAEVRAAYPDCVAENETILANALIAVTGKTGEQFFFIIDEWDALFREAKDDDAVQKEYIQLLRGLFKGGVATLASIAGAYMTGILPIKKYDTQSALTDFGEYTMVDPAELARFVGFTESEVKDLCEKYGADFDGMKQWYNGYSFPDILSSGDVRITVYSPKSVIDAIQRKKFKSYWTSSETCESLRDYISMNLDGLKDAVVG